MALFVDLLPGEGLSIEGEKPVVIHIQEKTGRRVRIRVECAREIPINRIDFNDKNIGSGGLTDDD